MLYNLFYLFRRADHTFYRGYLDMIRLKPLILKLLQDNPGARNDDRRLLVLYYRHNGLRLTQDQEEILLRLQSPASISRTRARIQNLEHRFGPVPRASIPLGSIGAAGAGQDAGVAPVTCPTKGNSRENSCRFGGHK